MKAIETEVRTICASRLQKRFSFCWKDG